MTLGALFSRRHDCDGETRLEEVELDLDTREPTHG